MRAMLPLAGVAVAAVAMAVALHAGAAGDPVHGQQIYESRCGGCHSLDANRVGPAHRGVYGRKAGSVPDYPYSAGVKSSTIVWGDETLDKWLTNPQAFIPGARMGFRLSKPEDRADVIAYLKQESGK